MIVSSSFRLFLIQGLFVLALMAWLPASLQAQSSFVRGDANVDASVDLSDGVLILQYLFQGGRQLDCLDSGDADDSGSLDLSDAVYDFNYLFLGGRPPPAPFAGCGEDPTADGLGCESYDLCDDKPPPPVKGGRNILVIISDDLGADSLDIVELVMAMEEAFDLEIPDEDAERIQTIGDAMTYVKERTQG